uniref:Uncharacterized protein n=1 Tax=Clastoptera arizonana TaxID=38151 RepID=A0A1B6E8E6_9HEMI
MDTQESDLKICCIKLSLAARVIAMVGLITSVLIMTQLSTEIAEPSDTRGTVSILFGLDIKEFEYTIQGKTNSSSSNNIEILIAFLLFSLMYAIASAILIWGTIVEQSWCALPWLICEAFSFATQISTLAIHAVALRIRTDKWIILISILNIGLTFYFWVVVFCAAKTWRRQRRESKANEISSVSRHNTLKEDSYTNGSSSPLPSKYVQV